MGGSQGKIITKDVPYQEIKSSSPIQVSNFCPPFRKYTNQRITNSNRQMNATFSVVQPNQQSINISQQYYSELEQAFDMKTKGIELDTVLFDDHYTDNRIYIAKEKNQDKTIQIKPFVKFNTHAFNNILYELHMNQQIAKINSPLLNTFIDSYAIQTGLEVQGQQFPNSQVLVLQPIATNLSQIIKYRRENQWNWTVSQFNLLAKDLSNAVLKLHENGISHNDIRPFNVFYSLEKQCYQLGGFANAVKQTPQIKSNIVRTSMVFGAPQLQVGSDSNLQQADIYSLGMTLLCAFYLCQPIDRKNATPYNRKYEDKYNIMKTIRQMILPIQRRQNLQKIIESIGQGKSSPKMKSLIQSLRYKNSPKDRKLILTKKALSQGYQRLGLWNEWRNYLNEAYQMEQNTLDDYNKAISLSGLAKIQSCRGDPDNANQYAKKASKIFRSLGYAAYDQGNVNESINLFNKAVQSSKYFSNENDIDLGKNLQGLALAHSQKGDYQVAKPLICESAQIVQKNNGKDSLDYCKIKMSQAQIQSDFGQFAAANLVLKECINIAENKAQVNQQLGLQLKAQILHDNAKNLMSQASFEQGNKQQLLSKAYSNLNQAMQINQGFPNNHIAISSNVQAFGQIQMRKGNFIEARNNFRKADLMRQTYFKEQNRHGENMQKQKADSLCHIAACETQLGEYKDALKSYNNALQIYKRLYGSDHNKKSAITIGNMSKIYYKMNQNLKAKQCIQIASQIIEDVSGQDDPDYEHFKSLEARLEQK